MNVSTEVIDPNHPALAVSDDGNAVLKVPRTRLEAGLRLDSERYLSRHRDALADARNRTPVVRTSWC